MLLIPAELAILRSRYSGVILASGSPRRKELLSCVIDDFVVEKSTFAEDLPKGAADDYVVETARTKGEEVAGKHPTALVISADTVVVQDGTILEKPTSDADARRMLETLSGSTHFVYTGVCLFHGPRCRSFCERTDVTFSDLSKDAIAAYVATGEPMDKAGAYGIQGRAGPFVERISGCYYNVVGLPMNRLARELQLFLKEDL